MRCEVSQRELSARLDGAHDRRVDRALDEHLAGCARCRAFLAGSDRLREVVRLEPAAPVPDLVPRIMAEVRRQTVVRPLRLPRRTLRPAPAWASVAASFVAGAVAAALVAGGLPGIRRGLSPALAGEIPGRIARASVEVTRYRASFAIVEQGFHPRVPERRFVAQVSFQAPERFRARVEDLTRYPSGTWPRNDLSLAVEADRWMLDAPRTCPRQALPVCAPVGRDVRAVEGRPPFDGEAALPTDIVLPMRTLAGSERVEVVRQDEVLDRRAVVVELAYRDAAALFGFLHTGGTWRPFFPHDRVLVSLDAESWFPLAYEVRAADSPERRLWADRNGLPGERADDVLFRAEARSLDTDRGPASPAPFPDEARDHGFRAADPDVLADALGGEPVRPRFLAGLAPYRAGVFENSDEVLLSYARGLSWLVIRETRSWTEPTLYGGVGALAQRVGLPGDGVGYYEPATGSLGRRLSIHADGWDLALESNLPRPALLEVAASLPVGGIPIPGAWLGQATLAEAVEAAPYLLVPTEPADYGLAAVFLDRAGVTLHFRRPGAELDGGGIRLHQASGIGLPPPVEPEVLAVEVRGVTGRYSPVRGELEWVEDGVYRSLGGMALDLRGLLAVAESLEPAR